MSLGLAGRSCGGLVLLVEWSGSVAVGCRGTSSVPKEAQEAFDKQQYEQVLEQLAKLEKEQGAAPDVRRLKIRSFLKLGNPKDALGEYDKLELALKQDEVPLLREVALGFIVVMVKDMREQMRGAAYTALKEVDSDDVVPYFEDGLSDGSGPVRVLAVEGLGRSEAGRKSTKLRTAIEDQAGSVKARVVKALGRTGDPGVMSIVESATKDELSTVRIAAYGALIRLGKKDAWTQLQQAAASLNPEDRADAIRTIAELKDQRGAPIMIESLTYKQPSVRGAAARGLGHLGRKEARGQIEQLLKDPIPAVRESAVGGLADLGGRSRCRRSRRRSVTATLPFVLQRLPHCSNSVSPTRRWPPPHNRWPNRTIQPCVLLWPMLLGRRPRPTSPVRFPC